MRRREFIAALGGSVAVWPLAARAQQPAMPVIGLSGLSQTLAIPFVAWGVGEIGFVEGRNVV
jgi:putative ABC transport system substrate-binding protein